MNALFKYDLPSFKYFPLLSLFWECRFLLLHSNLKFIQFSSSDKN